MTVEADIATMVEDLTRLLSTIARASLHDHRSADFAPILTGSLAAAAANVGGPDALLAGRPGSWESSYIRDLLRGAMSDRPQQWWSLMTEPVVVSLNVAELIEDSDLHPGLVGLYEAEDCLHASFDDDSDQDQPPEREAAIDSLRRRYADSYAWYAERFTAAVKSVAADLRLPPQPHVLADADPNSAWWEDGAVRNSIDSDSALVNELWERAHAIVPLPNVDIRRDQPTPTKEG
jgi:hypothetical protein